MTRSARRRCRTCRPALEQGTPNLEAYTWNAISCPRARPPPSSRSSEAAFEAMHTPAVQERLERLGAESSSDDRATPEYLGKFVKSEIEKWAGPIKASGVTIE